MARPSREALCKEAKAMVLCSKETEHIDCSEVQKYEDEQKVELVDNKEMDKQALCKEPKSGPTKDFVSSLEGERLKEDNIKTAVEVCWRRIVKGILGVMIEDIFTVGFYKEL